MTEPPPSPAASIRETVGTARRSVYRRPEGQPVIVLHIPDPATRPGPQTSDVGRTVKRDILFRGVTATKKSAAFTSAGARLRECRSAISRRQYLADRHLDGRPFLDTTPAPVRGEGDLHPRRGIGTHSLGRCHVESAASYRHQFTHLGQIAERGTALRRLPGAGY
jgi:hypothetical protein